MDARGSLHIVRGTADGKNPTGSCILLETEFQKTLTKSLFDIGLVQGGPFNETLKKNMGIVYEFNPASIDNIFITHAHVDHSGNLPRAAKYGFNGRIFCTKPTAELLPATLADCVRIQKDETKYRQRKEEKNSPKHNNDSSTLRCGNYDRKRRKEKIRRANENLSKNPLNEPLYGASDVEKCLPLIVNCGQGNNYGEWLKLAKGLHIKMYESGHVLGGASCVTRIKTRNDFSYIGITGDLGRCDGLVIPPPKIFTEPLNILVIESTYGGKTHPAREKEIKTLFELVHKTYNQKGKIIIPAFALERTQEIIYLLSTAMFKNVIPTIPICLDAPLAENHTRVFSANWDTPGLFMGQENLPFNPFCPTQNKYLRLTTTPSESDRLIASKEPAIIISGSGNCDAGRVRGHLRAELGNPNTSICIIGYMPENSLGRKLKEGNAVVKMNGQPIEIRASVCSFDSFSAHADGPFLCYYVSEVLSRSPNLEKVLLVHGEIEGALALKKSLLAATRLRDEQIIIPKPGEKIIL